MGRDSKTGRFIPVDKARRRPKTTTIERVPKPGYGDTGGTKKRSKTYDVYRDSKTGQFTTAKSARRRSGTVVKEQIPTAGHINPKSARVIGDTDKKYRKALTRLAKR